MNQTKLDELIKKYMSATFYMAERSCYGDRYFQGKYGATMDFIKDLKSLQSEQEVDEIPIPQIGSDNYKELKSEQEVEKKCPGCGVEGIGCICAILNPIQ